MFDLIGSARTLLRGIEIGSHTVTHPELKLLKLDEVNNETRDSKTALEDAIASPGRSAIHCSLCIVAGSDYLSRKNIEQLAERWGG